MRSQLEALGLVPGAARPEGGAVARTFTFDPPAMSAADWAAFAAHVSRSAVNFENALRGQGLARARDPLAVVQGIASTVAAAPPGGPVPTMRIALSDADQRLVRSWLSRSLMRAGDESASGDRPGTNDAARLGTGALLDQWESFIGYADPVTGRRARGSRSRVTILEG